MKKVLLIAAMALMTIAASAQQKFAHVNLNELITLSTDFVTAQKTLQASQQEAQDTYATMMDEFQSKYTTYQQKVSTWTEATKTSKEKELTDIQNRIQEFQQSIQAELAQQEQDLMAPVQQKAQDAVNKVAKAGGYVYVFEISQLLYVDDTKSTDITADCKKELGIAATRTIADVQSELGMGQE